MTRLAWFREPETPNVVMLALGFTMIAAIASVAGLVGLLAQAIWR